MTTVMPTLCASCIFLNKGGDGACPAYPKGIPMEISMYGEDHRQVRDDQVGTTVHVIKDGKEQEFENWVFTFVLPGE